jgi:hypothetical protein
VVTARLPRLPSLPFCHGKADTTHVGFFLQTYARVQGNDDRDAAEQAAAFLLRSPATVANANQDG